MSNVAMAIQSTSIPCWPFSPVRKTNVSVKATLEWYDTCMEVTSIYNQVDIALNRAMIKSSSQQDVMDFVVENNILFDLLETISLLKSRFRCSAMRLEFQKDEDGDYLELWAETDMTESEIVDNYLEFLCTFWAAKSAAMGDLMTISVTPA